MKALIRFMCQPFAVHEPTLRAAAEIVERHLRGEKLPEDDVRRVIADREARLEIKRSAEAIESRAEDPGYPKRPYGSKAGERGYYLTGATNSIAVVPIEGVICKYASMINGMSQPDGTTTEAIQEAMQNAVADRQVKKILVEIDSPGGVVSGLPEAAQAVKDAAAEKPTVALANGMAASAAYWIASQASTLYATPEAAVGSIGVYSVIEDSSEAWARRGVKFHLVKAGAHKGIGADGLPVTEEQLAVVQQGINATHRAFIEAALIRGRGMNEKAAALVADGRVHIGNDALTWGLIDGIRFKGQLIKELDAAN